MAVVRDVGTEEGFSYLSRSVDHLGFLQTMLRDLRGFATLAHELIQNADDPDDTSRMCFDIRDDALVVDNDGRFTDCGHMEASVCPWGDDPSREQKVCDFHSFRLVAGGSKRTRIDTTGAFGVGFTTVYQITDRPELISGGRHWIIDEMEAAERRVKVCPGCAACQRPDLPGTRFILPWARDAATSFRRALRAQPISTEDIDTLAWDLEQALPMAMIFLKRLERIELRRNGDAIRCLERLVEGDSLLVNDGEQDIAWHLIEGDFSDEADALRHRHGERIEEKRTARVTLAIPPDGAISGTLCAILPTQHETGLPFHVNADFFPSSDRKQVIFESDYQSEWNRAAIRGAARALASNVERLKGWLGYKRFWDFIAAVHRASQRAGTGEVTDVFGEFWRVLRPVLRNAEIIFTATGEWARPNETVLLEQEEEEEAIGALNMLGITTVHPDLRPYFNLLRQADVLGVDLLGIPHVVSALQRNGFTGRQPPTEQVVETLPVLWREVGRLLASRRVASQRSQLEADVARYAIALGRDGFLWPCRDLYLADEDTAKLFTPFDPNVSFLDRAGGAAQPIESLCSGFAAVDAIWLLGRLTDYQGQYEAGILNPADILSWFERRRDEVLGAPALRSALADLPIYPTAHGSLRPLSHLVLAGGFVDPLNITDIVDVAGLGNRRDFLGDLGVDELSFPRYVREHIPRAFADPDRIPAESKRDLVTLLASHVGELLDDAILHEILCDLPLVECDDGVFRPARKTTFKDDTSVAILGASSHWVVAPSDGQSSRREFYRWLGVADGPRFEDIVGRVRILAAKLPTPGNARAIRAIFAHIGKRFATDDGNKAALAPLMSMAWLPARRSAARWYRPNELYAAFRDYLFDTQGPFLDVDRRIQGECSEFLNFLSVRPGPEIDKVVMHLLRRSGENSAINSEVYTFLNNHVRQHPNDPQIARLRDRPCLALHVEGGDRYVKPDRVFWHDHPFGPFRFTLGSDLRQFQVLFSELGVREDPDYGDALEVLREVSSEHPPHRPVKDDTFDVVLGCWQFLADALAGDDDTVRAGVRAALQELRNERVVPDDRKLLVRPPHLIFNDRDDLAKKFEERAQQYFIARYPGAWRAMLEAGVRPLSTAISSHILDLEDDLEEGGAVAQRICERRSLIERALAAQSFDAPPDIGVLDQIRLAALSRLSVCYSVTLFGYGHQTPEESARAHYQNDDKTLYFVRQDDSYPWLPIARELAILMSNGDPGTLAFALFQVLAAQSASDAAHSLDEVGIPEIRALPDTFWTAGVAVGLGGEPAPLPGSDPVPESSSEALQSAEATAGDSAGDGEGNAVTDGSDDDSPSDPEPRHPTDGATRAGSGGPQAGQRSPNANADSAHRASAGSGSASHPDANAGAGTNRVSRTAASTPAVTPQRRFYSYVGIDKDDDGEGDSSQTGRNPIDSAGVEKVLQFERGAGRFPREMPHNHPGYDIGSDNAAGVCVRYIEVKSLAGIWAERGVALSRTQFELAERLGEQYWLYVVERAEHEDACIFPVRDPARQANLFAYDGGWRTLADRGVIDESSAEADA